MSGDRYYITDQYGIHFVTLTIVNWVDLFTRQVYRDIIISSLNYCCAKKGLEIYAWGIMSNHVHLVCKVDTPIGISAFLRDFKKYTSKQFIQEIANGNESRSDWMLNKFSYEAKRSGRATKYKVWKDDNHAIA